MTNASDDHPHGLDADVEYPVPPDHEPDKHAAPDRDEASPPTERAIIPVPPNFATSSFPIVRARRELKVAVVAAKTAMANLRRLEQGMQVQLDALAIDALIGAATDNQLPLDDADDIGHLRHRSRDGEFDGHVALAVDELEDMLATLDAAQSSLRVISLLAEPIPSTWDNLPTLVLARNLNRLGHTLLRGRIPGVSL